MPGGDSKRIYHREEPYMIDVRNCRQHSIQIFAERIAGQSSGRKVSKKECFQLRSPCKCRARCFENFSEDRRKVINEEFKSLDFKERSKYVLNCTTEYPVERRRGRKQAFIRSASVAYQLDNRLVCKDMFVRNLGVSPKIVARVR